MVIKSLESFTLNLNILEYLIEYHPASFLKIQRPLDEKT